eukprot:CAMPEP_0171208864 /NCGR_PEP_ID=MMETSP0790-20130122/28304_1 /TAXON_ID=2925 /ORGANISM="Alexandrium catenella, Strain OF101" /LENGTH=480 /DNA_ID=CAMNT_0011674465 /DNA_START=64 /DNA_END=1502 /DNA_ORIENTATION=-
MARACYCCVVALIFGGCASLRTEVSGPSSANGAMRRDHGGNPDKSQEASESTRGDHADAADEFQEALKSSVLDAIDAMQPDGSLELAQEASEASVLGAKPAKGRSGSGGFTLLTSLYMDASGLSQGHTDELVSAFIVNLANPNIWSVHVLFESNTSGGANACGRLPRLLREHSFASSLYEPHAHKITCVPVRQQPTYGDFFRYASSSLANHDVILANTDIVFDRTLALLKHPVDLNVAHVLSVLSPPYNGQYKQIFGKECQITNRCEIPVWSASTSTGGSWDAYIFRAPLPHSFNFTDLDFVMNINGAENLAGFQLETQGGAPAQQPVLAGARFPLALHRREDAQQDEDLQRLWQREGPRRDARAAVLRLPRSASEALLLQWARGGHQQLLQALLPLPRHGQGVPVKPLGRPAARRVAAGEEARLVQDAGQGGLPHQPWRVGAARVRVRPGGAAVGAALPRRAACERRWHRRRRRAVACR